MVQVTDNLSASAFSFSSPLGDGLVLDFGETIEEIFVFSSQLGDGLVPV